MDCMVAERGFTATQVFMVLNEKGDTLNHDG